MALIIYLFVFNFHDQILCYFKDNSFVSGVARLAPSHAELLMCVWWQLSDVLMSCKSVVR